MILISLNLTGVANPFAIAVVLGHLFLAIGLHELGHAMVARANGATGITITFWAFGGVCSSQRMSRPWSDLAIVIAGPLVSFILAASFAFGIAVINLYDPIPGQLWAQGYLQDDLLGYAFFILKYGVLLNVSLGIFNCLPIYPMDGGQATYNILHIFLGTEKKLRSNTIVASNERLVCTIMVTLSLITALAYMGYRAETANPLGILQYMASNIYSTLMIVFVLYWGYTSLKNR